MLHNYQADRGNGQHNGSGQVDRKVVQTFEKSFMQVQTILDQNRRLISEINQNQESKVPDNLNRNASLIRELNNNIKTVVHLYSILPTSFVAGSNNTTEGDSMSSGRNKRTRPPPDF